MNKTQIEWVKNPDGTPGFTWNPITGCLNHVNGMCKGGDFPCYAYRLSHGRLKERYLANKHTAPPMPNILLPNLGFVEMNAFYPRFWPERLKDIKRGYHFTDWSGACEHGAKARGIFVCDMADLFGIGIPEDWTRKVLKTIGDADNIDRFYLLTKQPQNLLKWSPFPENVYLGVTACNQEMFDKAIYYLAYHVQAKVKFISIEPFLKPIHTSAVLLYNFAKKENCIHQLIIGAQTKPYKPPKIEWVEEIVEAADKAGIKVFLKDNLKPLLPIKEPFYKQDKSWIDPKLYYYRQELPC